jgi:rhodanese-related sulfurtransferase
MLSPAAADGGKEFAATLIRCMVVNVPSKIFVVFSLMKFFKLLPLFFASAAFAFAAEAPKIGAAEAAKLVASGKAVLVDVREPAECAASGVAQPALLLPKSDFDGAQKEWKDFLANVGDKQVILYCGSGRRAGIVAAALAEKGIKTANVGGFRDWSAAGLPVRKVEAAAEKK